MANPKTKKTVNLTKISEAYNEACRKHPKFCDALTGAIQSNMALYEHRIKMVNSKPPYYGDFILNEEIAEALNAYLKGDKEHALLELAQCGAVILRMMDFLQNEIYGGKK